jgi:hypothetical protein
MIKTPCKNHLRKKQEHLFRPKHQLQMNCQHRLRQSSDRAFFKVGIDKDGVDETSQALGKGKGGVKTLEWPAKLALRQWKATEEEASKPKGRKRNHSSIGLSEPNRQAVRDGLKDK